MVFFTTQQVSISDKSFMLQVTEEDRKNIKPWAMKLKSMDLLTLKITIDCEFLELLPDGIISFLPFSVRVQAGKYYKEKTRSQVNLLKAIERIICFAHFGKEPDDRELRMVHQALIEQYAPRETNVFTNQQYLMDISDPEMTTVQMNKILKGAFDDLATTDIDSEVVSCIGGDLDRLFNTFKTFRMEQYKKGELDGLSAEEYLEQNKVCEFCLKPGTDFDPIERVHIISKGSDIASYEDVWSYFIAHHDHHNKIHANGWEWALKEFPHIKPKYERAFERIKNA